MSRPDQLAILADIARVAAEHPGLGEDVVRELRGRLRWRQPHEPMLYEFRAYVDRVSCLPVEMLREHLGLVAYPLIHRPRPAAAPPAESVDLMAEDQPAVGAPPAGASAGREPVAGDGPRGRSVRTPRPGRPGWTPELFEARYRAARERATPPYTYRSIAAQFEMLDGETGIDPDHLRKLMKRYGQAPG